MPRAFDESDFNSTDRKGFLLPKRLAKLQPIYDAVGRIGPQQLDKPTDLGFIKGTGILVSSRHILTNYHVAVELYTNPFQQDLGIEFGAEMNSSFSNFYLLKNISFRHVKGYDAAILTLRNPVLNRKPVSMSTISPEALRGRNILVIGYPTDECESRPALIRGIKRYTEGKVFSHSQDKDSGITVPVSSIYTTESYKESSLDAICHSASTLGGSSGSAVVDVQTAELVGIHFGTDTAYEYKEAANFAIPSAHLATQVDAILKSLS